MTGSNFSLEVMPASLQLPVLGEGLQPAPFEVSSFRTCPPSHGKLPEVFLVTQSSDHMSSFNEPHFVLLSLYKIGLKLPIRSTLSRI